MGNNQTDPLAPVEREGLSRAEYVLRAEEAERERDRLASEYQSYREASNLEGARDAAEIARLADRLDAAEKALRKCASTAGTPDEAQGCRNVIAIARAYFASVEGEQDGQ